MKNIQKFGLKSVALTAAALLALTGCAAGNNDNETPNTDTTQSAPAEAGALEFTESWAKATDGSMTGVFGDLKNVSDADVTITGGKADFADLIEVHETVEDGTGSTKMQEKEGGFTIKPGDTLELRPGGDHIMVMKLNKELVPGEEVTYSVTFADGGEQEFTSIIKEFAGANEEYVGDDHDEHGGHGDDEHGDH
ncbi:copper chaperone PCu(A)C [Micrococcoides hystricis]|uniref:Copper chaperone PCu(A)C n=1 Tax=Micrococcoides hystricis TaxID=1572761 RepID=A0ABV6PE47_9MICC